MKDMGGLSPGSQSPSNTAVIAHGGTVTGTTETVIASLKIPAGSLKLGSVIEFFVCEHNTTTNSASTLRCRIGSAGTTSDAAVQQFSTTPVIQTTTSWTGTTSITVIGASAAHIGNAFYVNAAGNAGQSGNTAATSTFNSSNASFVTLSLQNGTSVTRTVRGGFIRIVNP